MAHVRALYATAFGSQGLRGIRQVVGTTAGDNGILAPVNSVKITASLTLGYEDLSLHHYGRQ